MAKEEETVKTAVEEMDEKIEQEVQDKNMEIDESLLPDDITEEQKEYARITVRKEFNEKFSKWAYIEEEDCTDDELQEIKKEFEDYLEENKNKMYKIASHEDGLALNTAKFLKNWNEKFNAWEKGSWRGIIHFDKVISKIIEELEADSSKDLEIDYSSLIFLYQSMYEPKGMGLESARNMAVFENYNEETGMPYEENIPITYSGILEKITIEVQMLSNVDKKLNILKERVNLAYAGLKMTLKISRLEEFLEFYDAITAEHVDQDPDVKEAIDKQK